MKNVTGRGLAVIVAACVIFQLSTVAAAAADSILYRLFLLDGTSLVSFGEFARVADQVVLSIPLGDSSSGPNLQLVSIAASAVDWQQTDRYTEAVRARRYAETRGEDDYRLLGERVSQALNDVALTPDPAKRLAMAEEARKNLVQWPSQNFGYRAADVAQLAALFDEVISELRVAAGQTQFNVNLVATTVMTPPVALLPAPTQSELYQQALTAATLTTEPAERQALLRSISSVDIRGDENVAAVRAMAAVALGTELQIDKSYKDLANTTIATAGRIAARADVRGLQGLIERVLRADDRMGRQRPQETASLLALLDLRLDEARRLRLARDAWTMRMAALAAYRRDVAAPIESLRLSKVWLDDIKQLAGPPLRSLDTLEQRAGSAKRALGEIKPPPELASVHSMLGASCQMASRAASTRRNAVASKDMKLAWDASTAAAGAVMLLDQAIAELDRLARQPATPPSVRQPDTRPPAPQPEKR